LLSPPQNPQHHARSKHIDIQYHFIRRHGGTAMNLRYIRTAEMTADNFTKVLERVKRSLFCEGMSLTTRIEWGN
jgi:hypothetical protein